MGEGKAGKAVQAVGKEGQSRTEPVAGAGCPYTPRRHPNRPWHSPPASCPALHCRHPSPSPQSLLLPYAWHPPSLRHAGRLLSRPRCCAAPSPSSSLPAGPGRSMKRWASARHPRCPYQLGPAPDKCRLPPRHPMMHCRLMTLFQSEIDPGHRGSAQPRRTQPRLEADLPPRQICDANLRID